MKAWYHSLQPRERLIVILAAVAIFILLLYLMLWEPVSNRLETARQTASSDQRLLVWLQKSAADIRQLRGSGQRGSRPTNRNISLINAVESSARQVGIRQSITHLEPKGDTGINVQIKAANFDQLMRWQGTMQTQYAANAIQVSIKPTGQPGLVDANIRFSRSDS